MKNVLIIITAISIFTAISVSGTMIYLYARYIDETITVVHHEAINRRIMLELTEGTIDAEEAKRRSIVSLENLKDKIEKSRGMVISSEYLWKSERPRYHHWKE